MDGEARKKSAGHPSATNPGEGQLAGGGLCVRFIFRRDRYAHEIYVADGAEWRLALASVEGTAEDDWPPSPPLQSLHFEERPDGRQLALLVGMAGKSHWSASVELDATAQSIHFDIACRVRGAVGSLGSQYRVEHPGLSTTGPSLCLELDERFADTRLEVTDLAAMVVAPVNVSTSQATTIRWRYTALPR